MPSKSPSGTDRYSSSTHRSMVLNPDELEIWEMFYHAGLTLDPQVFRAIVDLIRLDVHPKAIIDMLSSVIPSSRHLVRETPAKSDDSSSEKSARSRSSQGSGRKASRSSTDVTAKSDQTLKAKQPSRPKSESRASKSQPLVTLDT